MSTPRTVAFHTLGCKLNFSETSTLRQQMEDAGFGAAKWTESADVYVLNTCSVTDFADVKCRKEVRRAKKRNPDAIIVVTGCYAQLKPEDIAEIEGVDLVLGAAQKFQLLDYIDTLSKSPGAGMIQAGDVLEANRFIPSQSIGDRTRSFMKVQDGCNYNCSFCTIPLARGKSRSDTIESAIARANELAAQGTREIVLTGVNLGDFGNGTDVIEGNKPKKEALFIDLLQAMDEQLDERIARLRISSIEPNLLTDEIIDFVAQSKRVVPHFHVPLQSGNDKQLAQMRRRYKRDLYASRVKRIRQVMPHAAIGVDVIVGFPGESEADFLESYRFISELDITYLHVFTYSERSNTLAAEMEDVVPMQERNRRNAMLRGLSDMKRRAHAQSHLGSARTALLERDKQPNTLSGYTDNYIKINISDERLSVNQLVDVKLQSLLPEDCIVKSAEV